MTSIGAMIKKLTGMIGTQDLLKDPKSHKFVGDMKRLTNDGAETRALSDNQVKWIEDLHERFFA